MPDRLSRLPPFLRAFGIVLAVLALAGRLGAGSLVVDAAALADVAALAALGVACDPGGGHGQPMHHAPDVDVAALADTLAQPSPTLTPPAPLPTRRQAALPCQVRVPGIRAPPTTAIAAAWPRGPPTQA